MTRKYQRKVPVKKDQKKTAQEAESSENVKKEPEADPEPEPERTVSHEPAERRMREIEVMYKGHKYVIPPFFQKENSRGEYRRLINDTMIELYMCQYLINEKYDDRARSRCRIFNSFFYTSLRLRMKQNIKEQPRRSDLVNIYRKIFTKKQDSAVLKKEIIVVPIHIEKPKHWFLAIIHNAKGAIRRSVPVVEDELKDGDNAERTFRVRQIANFEDTPECRIIIMDSLFTWPKYRDVLTVHHNKAIETLRLWLQMTAAAGGEELMAGRVLSAVCELLPKQHNSVDCGVYMMAYAEYFTWYNTQWTSLPTDSLMYLRMDPATEAALNTDTPRFRLDSLLEEMNNKVFETSE